MLLPHTHTHTNTQGQGQNMLNKWCVLFPHGWSSGADSLHCQCHTHRGNFKNTQFLHAHTIKLHWNTKLEAFIWTQTSNVKGIQSIFDTAGGVKRVWGDTEVTAHCWKKHLKLKDERWNKVQPARSQCAATLRPVGASEGDERLWGLWGSMFSLLVHLKTKVILRKCCHTGFLH